MEREDDVHSTKSSCQGLCDKCHSWSRSIWLFDSDISINDTNLLLKTVRNTSVFYTV